MDPPEHCAASWLYSSNRNPLGNCINARPETGLGSDSVRTRLLSSRLTAQLLSRNTGSAATPSRGTGDICLPVARATEGRAAPVATFLSPVARDYPSRALGGFFMPPHCDCSIKEQGRKMLPLPAKSRGSFSHLIHQRCAVNNLCRPACSPVIHTRAPSHLQPRPAATARCHPISSSTSCNGGNSTRLSPASRDFRPGRPKHVRKPGCAAWEILDTL